MNKLIKSIIGIAFGTTLACGALATAACGGNGISYDGIGSEYIVAHAEGKISTYTFEAECTEVENKFGTAFSGTRNEEDMILQGNGASNGYCVAGLCKKGMTVNFVIVSDRDVDNASLTLTLGGEMETDITLTPENYMLRVDPVSEEDVKYYGDGGAWGKWDQFFLGYYYDSRTPVEKNTSGTAAFEGYYIDSWDCGDIDIYVNDADPCGFDDFKITANLKLKQGLNCISLITDNDVAPPANSSAATVYATAPIVDCIKITTDAQLGLYKPVYYEDRGVTSGACKVS